MWLLRGLDTIPHDAGLVSVDMKPIQLTLGEEFHGDLTLKEHHLRRAARVVTLKLRTIDVDGKDATQGSSLVNGCNKLVSGQAWREVDDEDRAVLVVRNIFALVGREEYIALVVRAKVTLNPSDGTDLSIIETESKVVLTDLLHVGSQTVQDTTGRIV